MTLYIRNAFRRLWLFIGLHVQIEEPPVAVGKPEGHVSIYADGKGVEAAGQWYFKRDILDNLGTYFEHIKRLRNFDPNSYDLFRHIGMVLVPAGTRFDTSTTESMMYTPGHARVAFGSVAKNFSEHSVDKEKIYPTFIYFQKLDRLPVSVEPAPGEIYQVTCFYVDQRVSKVDLTHPMRFYVSIEGKPRLLKERMAWTQRLHPKTSASRRRGGLSSIVHHKLDYPGALKEMAKDHKCTVQEQGVDIFFIAYNCYIQASMGARVSIKRRGQTAAFTIDLLRTPYFFNDRDYVHNAKGSRLRIFHIVRTHSRVRVGGQVSNVKSHFRGSRNFMWNDHRVNISMPGKHHIDMLDCDLAGALFEDEADQAQGEREHGRLMDMKWAGKWIEKHMTG